MSKKLDVEYKVATPRWLGIDEIHIIKRPRCVISNIEERTVVNMLPNRNNTAVKQYLYGIPNQDNIEYVCMDMWNPYKDAVKDVLPGRQIIIDKFHVGMVSALSYTIVSGVAGKTHPFPGGRPGHISPGKKRPESRAR